MKMNTKKTKYLSRHPKNRKQKHSGRTCRVCGRDPYPNYFYCPSCHHKITTAPDFPDAEVNAGLDLSGV